MIGDCSVYTREGRTTGHLPLSEARATAAAHGGFTWIGLQEPSSTDIADVAAAFELPALAVEDAVRAHQRPKLETYGDLVFAIIKPVRYVDSQQVIEVSELALFIGPDFVVSVRHGESDVLRRVRAQLDAADPELLALGTTAVLYRAADLVVDGYEEALEQMSVDVDDIETLVFSEGEHDFAERIYALKREVAEFRRAVTPLSLPLERLAGGGVAELESSSAPLFRDVHDHLLRAVDTLEADDRLLSDVLQANVARIGMRQSQTAVQQNEDMRKISAWAAIALVPTAIAGIYGMNFDNMPELRWRYGYFVVLGVIGGICLALHRLFRRNNWL